MELGQQNNRVLKLSFMEVIDGRENKRIIRK